MERYTTVPFPAYRHRPGSTPHPERDPRGHSHSSVGADIEAPPVPLRADGWRDNVDYLYGIDLFNAGYWWEAHEAWERLWRLAAPEATEARFLQGLIQLAAARLKLALGEPNGAGRLRNRSLDNLREVERKLEGPRYMGLDLHEIVAVVEGGPATGGEEIVLMPRR